MDRNKCEAKGKGRSRRGYLIPAALVFIMVMMAGVAWAEFQLLGPKTDRDGKISEDTKSFRIGYINSVVGEGATSDAYETFIYFSDATADRSILFSDASGTVMLQSSYGLVLSGSDGQILIYNALSSSFNAKSVSGDVTIDNSGAATLGSEKVTTAKILNGADARILISTDASSGSVGWQAMSSDVTITNAGVATIGANKVTATKVYINSTTVTVAGGAVYNTEAVPVGSLMTGYAPSLNVNGTAFANNVFITSGLAVVCTTATPAYYQQYKVYYVMP